jgi:predicted transcriptional regulator
VKTARNNKTEKIRKRKSLVEEMQEEKIKQGGRENETGKSMQGKETNAVISLTTEDNNRIHTTGAVLCRRL